MKYEYLKGSEKDFEGAPEWARIVIKSETDNVGFVVELDYMCKYQGVSSCAFNVSNPGLWKILAERQPITEPSWDGVGLPPVGCEVEFKAEDGSWGAGTVLFVGEKRIFWRCHEDSMEYNCEIYPPEFRQIHSEADKKRDKAISEIASILEYRKGCSEVPLSGWIYTAIATGKIPGVKLED